MAFDPVSRLTDPAALHANREGRLASTQEARLGDGAYRSRFERVSGSVAAGAVALAASVYALNLEIATTNERQAVWAMSAAIVLLAAYVFRPWADPLGDDLRRGVVQRVTGHPLSRVRFRSLGPKAWRATYDVTVGGLRFPVPAWIWSAVDDARTVTAYYLPASMTLVSLEAADDDDHPPILPVPGRRKPVRTGRSMAIAYLGIVGAILLARAFLPPQELLPEIPLGLLFLAISGALFQRARSRT
jgi:hypothetical protein